MSQEEELKGQEFLDFATRLVEHNIITNDIPYAPKSKFLDNLYNLVLFSYRSVKNNFDWSVKKLSPKENIVEKYSIDVLNPDGHSDAGFWLEIYPNSNPYAKKNGGRNFIIVDNFSSKVPMFMARAIILYSNNYFNFTTKDTILVVDEISPTLEVSYEGNPPSPYLVYPVPTVGNVLHFIFHICGNLYARDVIYQTDKLLLHGRDFATTSYSKFYSPALADVTDYPTFSFVGEGHSDFNDSKNYESRYEEALLEKETFYCRELYKASSMEEVWRKLGWKRTEIEMV